MNWSLLSSQQRDARIHEQVMHLPLETPCTSGELDVYKDFYWQCTCGWEGPINGNTAHAIPIPVYTTDMNAAWKVVGSIHERLFSVRQRFLLEVYLQVSTAKWDRRRDIHWQEVLFYITPDIICKAALIAVGVVLEEEG